jgi:hypothetical protein
MLTICLHMYRPQVYTNEQSEKWPFADPSSDKALRDLQPTGSCSDKANT